MVLKDSNQINRFNRLKSWFRQCTIELLNDERIATQQKFNRSTKAGITIFILLIHNSSKWQNVGILGQAWYLIRHNHLICLT